MKAYSGTSAAASRRSISGPFAPLLVAALLSVSGAACGGEPEVASSATSAPSAPPAEVAPTEEQLPIVEDFEAEAEEQINDQNMTSELELLRKEIDAELK